MPLYMVWTQSALIVGEVDKNEIHAEPPNQRAVVRIHRPLMLMEQVQPGKIRAAEVKIGLAPLTASVYVPWIDVRWVMLAAFSEMEKAAQLKALYEQVSSQLHAQATADLEVVGKVPEAVVKTVEDAEKLRRG